MASLIKRAFDYSQLAAPGAGAALGAGAGWLLAEPALGLKEKKHKALVAALGALAGAAAGGAMSAMDAGGEAERRRAKLDEAGLSVSGQLMNPVADVAAVGSGLATQGALHPYTSRTAELMGKPEATSNRFLKNSPKSAKVVNALRVLAGGPGKGGMLGRGIVRAAPFVAGTFLPWEGYRQLARYTTKTD